ncbi:hypothetical protein FRC00_010342, partial [Tulasnella sp. 408]
MATTLANAPNRIIIGANDEVSTEKLLQALNLPTELRYGKDRNSVTGGRCKQEKQRLPRESWSEVVELLTRVGGTPIPGRVDYAQLGFNTRTVELWYGLEHPGLLFAMGYSDCQRTSESDMGGSRVTRSAGLFKQEEASDDDSDFFAVAEGEEEYVQEWDARNTDMKEDEEEEDGESSPSGGKVFFPIFDQLTVLIPESSFACLGGGIPPHHYREPDHNQDPEGPTTSITNTDEEEEECLTSDHNTGEDDSDQEMTEEDESEAIAEEPITSGYEANPSESDAARSPLQRRRGTPHPRAALSPSDRHTISDAPSTTSSTSTAQIDDPPANPSTPHGTNNVLGPFLDSTEDEMMGDAAERAMDGLVNGLSGLALPPPDEVQTSPSLQSGQSTTPGEPPQDSPDTSA